MFDVKKAFRSMSGFVLLATFIVSICTLSLSTYADDTVENLSVPQAATDSINVNSADALLLAKKLKGVGIKKAEAIIRYREINGSFTTLDDLMKVKGVGKSIINRNKVAIAF